MISSWTLKHQIAGFFSLEYPLDFALLLQWLKDVHTRSLEIGKIAIITHTRVIERLLMTFEENR